MKNFDYRVYDKKHSRLCYNDIGLVKDYEAQCVFTDTAYESYESCHPRPLVEVEIFIGITDIDNKKIYENDIVAHLADSGGVEYYSVVEYENGCFYFRCIEHPVKECYTDLANHTLKVVDNIHDNRLMLIDE